MDKNNSYRFLFHLHTYKSFDATITYKQLYKIVERYNITHLAITEHNNINSYNEFKNYLVSKGSKVHLIPAVEYTTEIGDIISLNIKDMIEFSDYLSLVKEIKNRGGICILPHPHKRKEYPNEIFEFLDFYEIINMRTIDRTFSISQFKTIKQIYGSDAHNFLELPGIINTFNSEKDFIEALKAEIIVPEISNFALKCNRFVNRVISKIRKKI